MRALDVAEAARVAVVEAGRRAPREEVEARRGPRPRVVAREHERVLHENDEVGVMHSIAHFANGSASEAVLSFARFKDGKIVRMETGATPLSEDYTLVGQDD